jgi:nuclease-like protein
MSELFPIIINFTENNPDLVTWSVAGLMLLLGLVLQRAWIKECISEWKLNRLLKKIGPESVHNVTIPDGMDGNIFIENLILTPEKILLLGVKKYQGLIFAADKIDLWTQVIGNKSYKFENPLRQLESDALALAAKIENSKIEEKVLFINGSEFPKGKPANIVSISDIKEWGRRYATSEISDLLQADWKRLLELAAGNGLEKTKDIIIDEDNISSLNIFSLLSITIVISLWLGWRLMQ